MTLPTDPKIYHIVHLDRLPSILRDGKLFSDEVMSRRSGGPGTNIGMAKIKERRLSCQVGRSKGSVGQYVPFYFCPRSVMLYLIFMKDHPDLTYRGGQELIIHLVSSFNKATVWGEANKHIWTFTNANASARYVEFYFTKEELNKLKWDLIPSRDFRSQDVKEAKQSEFLLKNDFPWSLVDEIGVYNQAMKTAVETLLQDQPHKPLVTVHREWYY